MFRLIRVLLAERRAARAAMAGKEQEFAQAADRIRRRERLARELGFPSVRAMVFHLGRERVNDLCGISGEGL